MLGKVRACASQEEAAYIGKALVCAAAHLATSVRHAISQHSNTPLHSLAKLDAMPQQRTNPVRSAPQQTLEACRLGRLPHAEGRQIRPRYRAGGAFLKAAHALQPPQSNISSPRCLHFTATQHTHSCNLGSSLAQEPGQGGTN